MSRLNSQSRSRSRSPIDNLTAENADREIIAHVKIENFPFYWTVKELQDFITINSNERIHNCLGFITKGLCGAMFIKVKDFEASEIIIQELNGLDCNGRKLVATQVTIQTAIKTISFTKEKSEWDLKVLNFPYSWTWKNVRTFVTSLKIKSTLIQDHLIYIKQKSDKSWLLTFDTSAAYIKALQVLPGVECEGRQLIALSNSEDESKFMAEKQLSKPQRLTSPTPGQDKNHTFGFTPYFLQSLGIKPPLMNKVFVNNLASSVDEQKLRKVFGYAGHITNVVFLPSKTGQQSRGMAEVEYDHPVDAVQAISLFHNQELMGQKMLVQMDKSPHVHVVPGPNVEPLKGNLVELEPLKQLLIQEIAELRENPATGPTERIDMRIISMFNNPLNLHTPMNPLCVNTGPNPFNQCSPYSAVNCFGPPRPRPWGNDNGMVPVVAALNMNPGINPCMMRAQGMGQPDVPRPGHIPGVIMGYGLNGPPLHMPRAPTNSTNGSANQEIDALNNHDSYRQPDVRHQESEDVDVTNENAKDTLLFRNLPRTVDLQRLTKKMRQVGEVKSAEITGEGRAIVRFAFPCEAERCLNIFNRTKVDGQLIDIQFF